MQNTSIGDQITCDFSGCSNPAVIFSPILDDEGEEHGLEMLCNDHNPNRAMSQPIELDAWLERIKESPVSGLAKVTDPCSFEAVSKLVRQTEALNNIRYF